MTKIPHHIPPAVTADTVIFTIVEDKLNVLLIKRSNSPFSGSWALPGGFVRENESTEKAATRVLKDKAGLVSVYLEQLYTIDEAGRDP
ncbi:MAG: NUDIX domain-containing protein, partial [bacterium]|nr:NUDIX domain-containing protein [bacterium]